MEDEEFERLKKLEHLIKNDKPIPRDDISWIIKKIRTLDTMTNLMAMKLTSPINDKDWVIKYYKEEAEKRLCGK